MSIIYIDSYRFASAAAPLLLDTYTGAAAAYSLRQLRTGVTNVVRVRRSSDNTEQDFTAAQITDGTLTAFCGVGDGFIRTWYDQSGNNVNLNQASASAQPQIVSSGSIITEGSRPAVLTNGTTQYMQSPNGALGLVSNLYIAAVGTITAADNRTVIAASNGSYGSTSNWFAVRRFNGFTNFRINTSPTSLNDINLPDASDYSLYQMQVRPNSMTAWRNLDTQAASTTITSLSLTSEIDIRAIDNGGSILLPSPGKSQEMLFWKLDQSANRAAIEANINAHYGIF
jgi:hypothetical protein